MYAVLYNVPRFLEFNTMSRCDWARMNAAKNASSGGDNATVECTEEDRNDFGVIVTDVRMNKLYITVRVLFVVWFDNRVSLPLICVGVIFRRELIAFEEKVLDSCKTTVTGHFSGYELRLSPTLRTQAKKLFFHQKVPD